MRNIKLLILLFLTILLSGCSIDYNITITKDGMSELFYVDVFTDNENNMDDLYTRYKEEYPIFIDEEFMYYDPYNKDENYTYYNKNYSTLNEGYRFSYGADYNNGNILRARTLNTAFKTVGYGYVKEKDYYYVSLRNPIIFNNYNNIDNLSVNIKFSDDFIVIESDANSINNGIYTWNIKNNSTINVKYQLKNNESNEENPKKEEVKEEERSLVKWVNDNLGIVFLFTFVILISIIVLIVVVKRYKL